ncbi:PEBP-like protein [Hypomontagnella submonticulosa]|nr:PEBP-like protein [Hypomontagnella submonticulosa]
MLYKSLVILAGVSATLAATPQGFEPAAEASLLVSFGSAIASDGNVLEKAATQSAPSIGTQSRVEGTSFAVLMIDLDIPTNSPPATNTLLHWMQTGLTQSTTATPINTTTGSTNAFLFQNSQGQTAFAEYFGPSPPARIPLSHRYTEILVDTSDATNDELSVLQKAATSRMGFNALSVLTEAGLADKVVAGNFFNVTNPGPVTSGNSANSGNSTSGNGSGSGGSTGGSAGTGIVTPPTQTPFVPASAVTHRASGMLVGIAMVGAVFISL